MSYKYVNWLSTLTTQFHKSPRAFIVTSLAVVSFSASLQAAKLPCGYTSPCPTEQFKTLTLAEQERVIELSQQRLYYLKEQKAMLEETLKVIDDNCRSDLGITL